MQIDSIIELNKSLKMFTNNDFFSFRYKIFENGQLEVLFVGHGLRTLFRLRKEKVIICDDIAILTGRRFSILVSPRIERDPKCSNDDIVSIILPLATIKGLGVEDLLSVVCFENHEQAKAFINKLTKCILHVSNVLFGKPSMPSLRGKVEEESNLIIYNKKV